MPDRSSDVEALMDEHRGCLALLKRVETCVHGGPEPIDGDQLRELLQKLDKTLRKHFKGEEEGFFAQLPVEQPWLAESFATLEKEHETILSSLDALIETAGKPLDGADGSALSALKIQAQRLILTLRRHEAQENELVMDAHWYTLGNLD